MFKPAHPDTDYDRGKYMLKTLGLAVRGAGCGPGDVNSTWRMETASGCCLSTYRILCPWPCAFDHARAMASDRSRCTRTPNAELLPLLNTYELRSWLLVCAEVPGQPEEAAAHGQHDHAVDGQVRTQSAVQLSPCFLKECHVYVLLGCHVTHAMVAAGLVCCMPEGIQFLCCTQDRKKVLVMMNPSLVALQPSCP